jgi:hypothetical protein
MIDEFRMATLYLKYVSRNTFNPLWLQFFAVITKACSDICTSSQVYFEFGMCPIKFRPKHKLNLLKNFVVIFLCPSMKMFGYYR